MVAKRVVMLALTLFCLGLTGCDRDEPISDQKPAQDVGAKIEMERTMDRLRTRIEQLEVAQARLIERIEETRFQPIVIRNEDGEMDIDQITDIIDAQVADRLASSQERKVAEIALNEIKAFEERKAEAEERERIARREEREVRRRERELDRVAEIGEQLGLSERQTEELIIARMGLQSTIREVFDYMREQGSFDRTAVRSTISELQDEHRKIVSGFMSSEQVETYMEQNSFNPAWGRRMRGR